MPVVAVENRSVVSKERWARALRVHRSGSFHRLFVMDPAAPTSAELRSVRRTLGATDGRRSDAIVATGRRLAAAPTAAQSAPDISGRRRAPAGFQSSASPGADTESRSGRRRLRARSPSRGRAAGDSGARAGTSDCRNAPPNHLHGARLLEPKDARQVDAAWHRHMEVLGGRGACANRSLCSGQYAFSRKAFAVATSAMPAARAFSPSDPDGAAMPSFAPSPGRARGNDAIPNFAHMRPNCVNGSAPVSRSS